MKRIVLALALVGCSAPEPIPFGRNGEAWFAVVQGEGEALRGTGILALSASAPVYFTEDAIALAWSADAIEAQRAPDAAVLANDRLRPATGCEPRLPPPSSAVRVDDGRAVDVTTLPPLTAAWMSTACEDVAPTDITVDAECKLFRCPLTVTSPGRCRYALELDCELGRMDATLWPDGTLCLESLPPLACEAEVATPPRAATYTCRSPEACVLHAYVDRALDLEVDTIRFLDVEPYSPVPGLIGQLVLPPPAGRFFGYAHDFAISNGVVALSVGEGQPFTGCGEVLTGTVEIYDVDTLVRTASAAVDGCIQRVAPTESGFLGMESRAGQFFLSRLDLRGRVTQRVAADPRFTPAPGEAPLLFTADARVTYFDVVGDYVVAAVVTGDPLGTKVFTWDRSTLVPLERAWLLDVTIVHGARVDEATVILGDTEKPRVHWFELGEGRVRDFVQFPPAIDREDHFVSDVSWTGEEALLTLSRKNAGVYPVTRSQVLERTVIFDDDARTIATLRWPGTTRALVAGTWSTDQVNWPASLHELDLETQRFVPGVVPTGHGMPGRMIADERGRIWVLLPWDAQLLRVTR